MTDQQLIDEGYKVGKKSFEYLTEQIYGSFDFKNVHKAMKATNWNWSLGVDEYGNPQMGIPSLDNIRNLAHSLLKEVYEAGKGQISTGGFRAGWDDGELYLQFTFEEASTPGHTS